MRSRMLSGCNVEISPSSVTFSGLLWVCQGVLARFEVDLLERTKASPAVTRALEARYEAEKKAERTAESFAGWTALLATQVAAAWVLSCVFVRTLEDRGLLKQARLASEDRAVAPGWCGSSASVQVDLPVLRGPNEKQLLFGNFIALAIILPFLTDFLPRRFLP